MRKFIVEARCLISIELLNLAVTILPQPLKGKLAATLQEYLKTELESIRIPTPR